MIHEQICTYEVCKLAKEKGFRERCTEHYYDDTKDLYRSSTPQCYNFGGNTSDAPTHSLLQRWLREEKGIHISVEYEWVEGIDDWTFWAYIKKINNAKVVNDAIKSGFDTYELALEDALKYALNNLI